MIETIFILKKDLPTIMAGRVIKLSDDGKTGSPILMSVEESYTVQYVFPINVLREEKEWFDEATGDNAIAPQPVFEIAPVTEVSGPPQEEFKRGDRVNFKGDGKYAPMNGTYVWVVSPHGMLMYYIEHPDGDITKERIAHNGGLPDGFETPHSSNFKEGLNYICVTPNQLEKA